MDPRVCFLSTIAYTAPALYEMTYYRLHKHLTFWTWLVHAPVVYFFLRDHRKALAVTLPFSTVGSMFVLLGYIVLLCGNPRLEWDLGKERGWSRQAMVARSVLFHVVPPLLLVGLTLAQKKTKNALLGACFAAVPLLHLVSGADAYTTYGVKDAGILSEPVFVGLQFASMGAAVVLYEVL